MEPIVINPSGHRLPSLEKKAPPINTRTCLWHPNKECIFVEGVGETDDEKLKSVAAIIKSKLASGYTRERGHGQHPHSHDDARVEMQQRLAGEGDKEARAALAAKASRVSAKASSLTEEELALENQLLRERLEELEKSAKK